MTITESTLKILVANITFSTSGHISTSPSPTLSDVSNHSLSEQIAAATKK
jgi:hypothetical protein